MSTHGTSLLCLGTLLLGSTAAVCLLAHGRTSQESQCFSIHVRLNGKLIDGPKVIAVRTGQTQITASLEGGCFKVPADLLAQKKLDLSFAVPGNKLYLSSIPTGFFAGPWDIDLADRKFGSAVSLPKGARTSEACAVVFHVGEPETAVVQTGCRKATKAERSTHPGNS